MRWLAFGTYDASAHPRVAVLLEGLAAHGHVVDEVNAPLGLPTSARVDAVRHPARLPGLALLLVRRWVTLTRRAWPLLTGRRGGPPYDGVLVGYLGHLDVLLAKALLTAARLRHPGRRRPVLVLDHLVSGAGTAADRGLAGAGGAKDRLLRALDRAALGAADVILLDTDQRRAELDRAQQGRAVVVPVGATQAWFDAGAAAGRAGSDAGRPLRVVFVGLFTPLQGTGVIAEALAELADETSDGTLEVTLAGHGQDLAAARRIAGDSPAVHWLDWVPAAQLPTLVSGHDVGLGIFGTTVKAGNVVPTKAYQAAAAGCVLLTSDTVPQRISFGDAAMYVPAGDAPALAAALRHLAGDPETVARLRSAGRDRALADYTPRACVQPLLDHLTAVPAAAPPEPPT